jgi:hypothetical protein
MRFRSCDLPPELLVRIFNEVKARDGSLRVVDLSQVCSRWRAAALGASEVWSFIRNARAPQAAELLRRSRFAPLHVRYSCHEVPTAPDMDGVFNSLGSGLLVVLAAMVRLRSLEIVWCGRVFNQMFAALQQPAPLLESIHVERAGRLSESPPTYTICGDLPVLRMLSFIDVPVSMAPCGMSVMRSLRELNLVNPLSSWDVQEMLQALSAMEVIERLCLVGALGFDPEDPGVFTGGGAHRRLPATLSNIILEDHATTLLSLLTSCELPDGANVSITANCWDDEDLRVDTSEIASILRPWLARRVNRAPLTRLCLAHGHESMKLEISGPDSEKVLLFVIVPPFKRPTSEMASEFLTRTKNLFDVCLPKEFVYKDRHNHHEGPPIRGLRLLIPRLGDVRKLVLDHALGFLELFNDATPLRSALPHLINLQLSRVDLTPQAIETLRVALANDRLSEIEISHKSDASPTVQALSLFADHVAETSRDQESDEESDEEMDVDYPDAAL